MIYIPQPKKTGGSPQGDPPEKHINILFYLTQFQSLFRNNFVYIYLLHTFDISPPYILISHYNTLRFYFNLMQPQPKKRPCINKDSLSLDMLLF